MSPIFERKNIRLRAQNYVGTRIYFLTFCFHRRQRFGLNAKIATWLVAELKVHADNYRFGVHAYTVMPDHVHALFEGWENQSNLLLFANMFKQRTGHEFRHKTNRTLWQAKYYDHIVRRAEAVDRIASYIWMNPVRRYFASGPKIGLFQAPSRK